MKNKKIKKFIKNENGSALILTMIVLVNAILIITAIGSISILEQKSSSRTRNSTPALQAADSGLECILKRINDNPTSTIDDVCVGSVSNCTCSGARIYFLDGTSKVILVGTKIASQSVAVRSVGTCGTGQQKVTRVLEADL